MLVTLSQIIGGFVPWFLRLYSTFLSYILSMAVSDWSGKAFISGFNEAGEAVFGMTGNELKNLQVHAVS